MRSHARGDKSPPTSDCTLLAGPCRDFAVFDIGPSLVT